MIPSAGNYHVGRAWTGHEIEDGCPCPKGPCGLVHGPLDTCTNPGHGDRDCPAERDLFAPVTPTPR